MVSEIVNHTDDDQVSKKRKVEQDIVKKESRPTRIFAPFRVSEK